MFGKILVTVFIIGILYELLFSNVFAGSTPLLVGTTGDYPPFTLYANDNFSGTDIQVIRDFAASQKLEIRFIHTSWQTLSADLGANKFDIAVGGISSNPQRMQLFYLSDAIASASKVPLVKCKDLKRFNNFAAIDKKNVRVVENRGGTNQDFALQHIKRATIVLVPNNFDALNSLTEATHSADVMFTDDIEANYRHKINPALCLAVIPEKFPSSDKVFIFTKTKDGKKLQQKFNHWWKSNKNNFKS